MHFSSRDVSHKKGQFTFRSFAVGDSNLNSTPNSGFSTSCVVAFRFLHFSIRSSFQPVRSELLLFLVKSVKSCD